VRVRRVLAVPHLDAGEGSRGTVAREEVEQGEIAVAVVDVVVPGLIEDKKRRKREREREKREKRRGEKREEKKLKKS
jgi:hypothetical protein